MSKWYKIAQELLGEAEISDARAGCPRGNSADGSDQYWKGYNIGQAEAFRVFARLLTRKTKPKPSKWHKVEDELPPLLRIVEVHLEDGSYDTDFRKSADWHRFRAHAIIRWRELPKFKKGK
jgi:hypothetical protein